MASKITKIFIAENVPSLNKGEMTILGGMLESLSILGNLQICMISDLPAIDKPRCEPQVNIIDVNKYLLIGGESWHRSWIIKFTNSLPILSQHLLFLILYKVCGKKALKIMKAEIWRRIVEADAIILGHDGAFGLGGSLGAPIFLYPVIMPFFAKKLNKPVMFFGGSIFKITGLPFFIQRLLKAALNNFDIITLRDQDSFQNIQDIHIKAPQLFLTADPACLLRPASKGRVSEIKQKEGLNKLPRPVIGVTFTRVMASVSFKGLPRQESYERHNQLFAAVIDRLITTLNVNIVFFPHCIGHGQPLDDRIVNKDIIEKCQNKDRVKKITEEYSASELKGLIGECDLFVGERIHSVINALTMYVPSLVVVPASDQRLGIIKMIGQEKAIYNIDNIDESTIFAKIMEIWEKRIEIKNELILQVKVINNRAMLNGTLLKDLLESYRKNNTRWR